MSELFNKIASDVEAVYQKKKMRSIEIDLTYDDVDTMLQGVAYDGDTLEWIFPTNDGEEILIKFVQFKD